MVTRKTWGRVGGGGGGGGGHTHIRAVTLMATSYETKKKKKKVIDCPHMRENASSSSFLFIYILKITPPLRIGFLNLTAAAQLNEFMPSTSHNSVHKVSSHKRGFLTFPFRRV